MPKKVGEKVILKIGMHAELTQPCMTKCLGAAGEGWEGEERE